MIIQSHAPGGRGAMSDDDKGDDDDDANRVGAGATA